MEEIFSIKNEEEASDNSIDGAVLSVEPQEVALADEPVQEIKDDVTKEEFIDLGDSFLNIVSEEPVKENKSFFSFLKKKDKAAPAQENEIMFPLQENKEGEHSGSIKEVSLNDEIHGASNADIFKELELGELNFGDIQENQEIVRKKFDPLVFTQQSVSTIYWVLLILVVLFWGKTFILGSNMDTISKMPLVCDYIGSQIEGYENTDCKTLDGSLEQFKEDKKKLEKIIVTNLSLIIPKKIETDYVLASPEVRFIQEKNSSNRVPIAKMLGDFEDLRIKSGGYQGKNIECSKMSISEQGDLSVACNFYGGSVIESTNDSSILTSRGVALDFLKKLQQGGSNFTIVDYPRNIEISKYNGGDGIKVLFSTTTNLNLKLKYSLNSK